MSSNKDILTIGLAVWFVSALLFVPPAARSVPQPSASGALHPLGSGSQSLSRAQDYAPLLSKVRSEGVVRVIVRLNVPFAPEGELSAPQAEMQRAGIVQLQDEVLDALASYTVTSVKRFHYVPYIAMEVDEAALSALIEHPSVVSIQEDVPVPPALAESVPLIQADQVWASGYTGAGWTIAILDAGVDKTHSFLSGKVVSEACYSTNSVTRGVSSLCPNRQSSQVGDGAGINCDPSLNGCDHGTHVAGIAAGRGNDFSGVARDATIISIQVFSRFEGSTCTNAGLRSPCILAYTSDQMRGLERVYELREVYNIAAVNMSLGGGRYTDYCDDDPIKPIIDQLRSVGIATVIAAGNDEYTDAISGPACVSTAVSVGATTKSDTVASYSNSASILSLLAPGSQITSSVPGNRWRVASGTSMATPHVAGCWALLKQYRPSASVGEILRALQTNGVPIRDARNGLIKPRVQCLAALNGLNPISLEEALDNPSLMWVTGGNAEWYGQSTRAYFGGDAAASGTITHSQSTYIQTTVIGPGTLTFYWKVSSERGYDFLRFLRNGSLQVRISGEVDWEQRTFSIPAGIHTLRWEYRKDGSVTRGQDTGWLDYVVFTGGSGGRPPTAITNPATNVTPNSATLQATVNPNGLATTVYFQWGTSPSYGNTTPSQTIGGGTSPVNVSANLTGLSPNATYHYRIVASNSVGTSFGSNVSFTTGGSGCSVAPITIGQTVSGSLSTSDCRSPVRGSSYYADRYSFSASAGQQVAILLTSSAFDTYLYLLGPSGSVIAQDDDGGGGTNSRIPSGSGFYSLPSSGTYIIEVTSYVANSIGNYTLSLSGSTSCTYSISPTSQSFGAAGGSGTVTVTAAGGCSWTATSNASWITITSGNSGTGSGTVTYSVAANIGTSFRTGTMTIAGQTFTVNQAGTGTPVTVLDHTMTNANPPGSCAPPPRVYTFLTTDARAYSWTLVSGARAGDSVQWQWYQPNGAVYLSDSFALSYTGSVCFWYWISIAGYPPAGMPGTWTVRVFYNGTLIVTETFTITQTGGNRLLNPGFESGSLNWVQYSSSGYSIITNSTRASARTGSWYAWFGGLDNVNEYLYQDVTIPANATQAYVEFWYRILTEEISASTCFDRLVVEVRRPSDNALLATLTTLCNYSQTSVWTRSGPLNVVNFRGQTIRLRFSCSTDWILLTSFFVDDVALMTDGN